MGEVGQRLGRLYEALETSKLTMDDLAPRIQMLRLRQDQLHAARDDVEDQHQGRGQELLNLKAVTGYVEDLRSLLNEASLAERKSFIKSFVKEIRVAKDHALLRYTIPLPPSGILDERAGVLSIVPFGGAGGT